MAHIFRFLLTPLLVLALSNPVQAEDWIKLRSGNEVLELPAGAHSVIVPINIDIDADKAFTLSVIQVKVGERKSEDLLNAFEIDTTSINGNFFKMIILLDQANSPKEDYEVLILASSEGEEDVELSITFKHPAAVIRSIPKVLVNNVRWAWQKNEKIEMKLILDETGGKSRITKPTLAAHNFTTPDNLPLTVDVTKRDTSDDISLPPSSKQDVDLDLSGRIPVGTTSGTLEFNAHQLDSPLVVPIEIQTRLPYLALFIILFAGFGLGWLLRKNLPKKIALTEQRIAAIGVLKILKDALAANPDQTFHNNLKEELQALQMALKTDDHDTIKEAHEKATSALTEQTTALKTRHEEFNGRMDDFRELTEHNFDLPKVVASALDDKKKPVQDLTEKGNQGYYTTAMEASKAVQSDLAGILKYRIRRWKREMRLKLRVPLDKLPKSVEENVKSIFTNVSTAVDNVQESTRDSNLTELGNVLKSADAATVGLQGLQSDFAHYLSMEAVQSINALRSIAGGPKSPESIEKFIELYEQFNSKVEQSPVEDALVLIRDTFLGHAFTASWKSAITDQLSKPPSDTLKNFLKERSYLDAAQHVQAIASQAFLGLEGATITTEPELLPIPEKSEIARDSAKNVRTSLNAMYPFMSSTSDELNLEELRKKRRRLITTRDLASLVLIVLIGYGLYFRDFTGKTEQVLAILLWAFAIDIAVDKITETGAGLKKYLPS